jgi:hypothetical protein
MVGTILLATLLVDDSKTGQNGPVFITWLESDHLRLEHFLKL